MDQSKAFNKRNTKFKKPANQLKIHNTGKDKQQTDRKKPRNRNGKQANRSGNKS